MQFLCDYFGCKLAGQQELKAGPLSLQQVKARYGIALSPDKAGAVEDRK